MDKITIAQILKPQGVHGDVKISVFSDDDFDFSSIKNVFVEDTPATIDKIYKVGGGYAVKLSIIESRNQAEAFRNKFIKVEKSALKLANGRFLMVDLIGKIACLDDGTELGKIVDIQNFGSADVIYISGKKNIMCSHKKGLIEKVGENVVLNNKIFSEVGVYED